MWITHVWINIPLFTANVTKKYEIVAHLSLNIAILYTVFYARLLTCLSNFLVFAPKTSTNPTLSLLLVSAALATRGLPLSLLSSQISVPARASIPMEQGDTSLPIFGPGWHYNEWPLPSIRRSVSGNEMVTFKQYRMQVAVNQCFVILSPLCLHAELSIAFLCNIIIV